MKNASTLSSICFMTSLLFSTGCKHTSKVSYHPNVTETVGTLVIGDNPDETGAFVTTGEIEKVSATSEIPVQNPRGEYKPLQSMKLANPQSTLEPMRLPNRAISDLRQEEPKPLTTPVIPTMLPASGIIAPLSKASPSQTEILPTTVLVLETKPQATPLNRPMNVSIVTDRNFAIAATPTLIDEVGATNHPRIAKTPGIVARAADFKWLIGDVMYSHVSKSWRIRFSSIELEDDYGGSLTLIGKTDLFEKSIDGHRVKVEGEIMEHDGSPSPRYLVSRLTILN